MPNILSVCYRQCIQATDQPSLSASEQSHGTHRVLVDVKYEECIKVCRRICLSSHEEKIHKFNTDVLAAIDELIDFSYGEEEDLDCSNNWMKLATRGGLIFVKNTTYGFSCNGIGCEKALLQRTS